MISNTKNSSHIFDGKDYVKVGVFCLFIFAGGLGSWMALSQLDSAAIAPGIISVEGQRKAVEHLEGGIVEAVLINDGDAVEVNQPLIRLSAVTARTHFVQLKLKYYSLLAQQQRLHHERKLAEKLIFDPILLEAVGEYPSLGSVLETQQLLFNARMSMKHSELLSFDTKLLGLESDKKVLVKKIEQEKIAMWLLNKEVNMHDKLLDQGYSSHLKSYELKRTKAKYSGSLIELNGQLQNNEMISLEARQQQTATKFRFISEVESELQDITKVKDDTLEQLVKAEDILSRVIIKSPHKGQIVGLSVFNKGDVVSPGETLLQVVPLDERLIVVAKLKPEDIDVVKLGQVVMVRLSAYSFRSTPPIAGEVIHVAADRLDDNSNSATDGFIIKVSLNKRDLEKLNDVELHPGMPAEIFIKLKSRTPLDYLLEPLSLDLFRAFREG
ncbi:HlyD family type I secretion periplasmic adaptor subunit [Psychromonas sp. RZ22]|uniref:HlyD family type I secretion periplasmic adaptor subunit n=1 Tax=Psychromonas algarum TaxID=2555643 RepID=UPI001067F7A3|nr:HlyD family type I secretion periplasmic adaptor subunit [Psychromonas sp. RZ22]TEW56152.1 HlyD family type I secretion periplasmic adaptor subunit [Psychromonas sp. RZ22]